MTNDIGDSSGLKRLAQLLCSGRVAVYPTETLYALGCSAADASACDLVAEIKSRPANKPLPLIIGSHDDLSRVTDHVPDDVKKLASLFWPGPLSILVKAADSLAPHVSDDEGFTSVRLSPHAVAAYLSREAGPLVATSANISGHDATATPDDIDPQVLSCVHGSFLGFPRPFGGLPSTVVRPLGNGRLQVLRSGAVGSLDLEKAGFVIE